MSQFVLRSNDNVYNLQFGFTDCSILALLTVVNLCDLSVATGHKQKHPALTSSIKAGTRLTYPGWIEG